MSRVSPARPARAGASRIWLGVRVGVLGVLVAMLFAACTSSQGQVAPASTTPVLARSAATASGPASSASVSAVSLPSPTSTATRAHLTKPPGLRTLGAAECTNLAEGVESLLLDLRDLLDAGPLRQAEAKASLPDLVNYIGQPRGDVVTVKRTWLVAGYPASFPTVRDIDAILAALDRLRIAARSSNLQAIPAIYLALNSADEQYGFDATYVCAS